MSTDWEKEILAKKLATKKEKNRNILSFVLFLTGFTLAVYYQVVEFDFINLDDPLYVAKNSYVQSGLNVKSIIWAFSTQHVGYWIPLTWLSFMVDFELYGLWPGGYHLTNVMLHLLNALLLFYLLKRMSGKVWRSAFVAALFSLHPLQVESVAWVTERKDVLSTVFFLLTLFMYVRYVSKTTWKNYLLLFVCYLGGLMVKPMLVTLPFVLLLLDYWPLDRFRGLRKRDDNRQRISLSIRIRRILADLKTLIIEKFPLFFLTGVFSVLTVTTKKSIGALTELHSLPLSVRLANALVSYSAYIKNTFFPFYLGILYPHPGDGLPLWKPVLSAGLLTAITVLCIWHALRGKRYCITGWLWFLGGLFPVIGLFQAGGQSMADRFCYTPIIGLFIIIVWSIADLTPRFKRGNALVWAGFIIIVTLLGLRTGFQTGLWRDSSTIFEHTLAITNDNFLIHANLGAYHLEQGNIDCAIEHFNKSIEIHPYQEDVHYYLGQALSKKGMTAEAIAQCRGILNDNPNFALGYINLGNTLFDQGKMDEARMEYQKALQVKPDLARAYFGLGKVSYAQENLDDAISMFRRTLSLKPRMLNVRIHLGIAYYSRDDFNEAIEELQQATGGYPNESDLFFNLGKAYKAVKRLDDAVDAYHKAAILCPNDAEITAELGTVYAMQGRVMEAIRCLKNSVRLNPSLAESRYNLGLVLELAGKHSEAVKQFEEILALPGAQKYYELAREAQSRINKKVKK